MTFLLINCFKFNSDIYILPIMMFENTIIYFFCITVKDADIFINASARHKIKNLKHYFLSVTFNKAELIALARVDFDCSETGEMSIKCSSKPFSVFRTSFSNFDVLSLIHLSCSSLMPIRSILFTKSTMSKLSTSH